MKHYKVTAHLGPKTRHLLVYAETAEEAQRVAWEFYGRSYPIPLNDVRELPTVPPGYADERPRPSMAAVKQAFFGEDDD